MGSVGFLGPSCSAPRRKPTIEFGFDIPPEWGAFPNWFFKWRKKHQSENVESWLGPPGWTKQTRGWTERRTDLGKASDAEKRWTVAFFVKGNLSKKSINLSISLSTYNYSIWFYRSRLYVCLAGHFRGDAQANLRLHIQGNCLGGDTKHCRFSMRYSDMEIFAKSPICTYTD